MKLILPTLFILLSTTTLIVKAQESTETALYRTILQLDSMLFEEGFNRRNIQPFEDLVAEDLTLYHDQSGVVSGKSSFIENTKNGLFALDYLATRDLIMPSVKIYPLHQNGKVYGAIQHGEHHFYATYPGQKRYVTSTAKFTHLWLRRNDVWVLQNVLSYDHQEPH